MMRMEYVSGSSIKLRTIFLDNGNWWKLFLLHRNLIRLSIIINVLKLLVQNSGNNFNNLAILDIPKTSSG